MGEHRLTGYYYSLNDSEKNEYVVTKVFIFGLAKTKFDYELVLLLLAFERMLRTICVLLFTHWKKKY